MSVRSAVLACILAATALPAAGETAYVHDRLEVGLHEAANLASTILDLLPSGAVLEVLERNGDMVRVQADGGAAGWVDARFLTDQPPGGARIQELERELAGAQAALADAQAKLVAASQAAESATPPSESEGDTPGIPSDALREMQSLAEENQRLKQQVAELEAMQRMSLEQVAAARAAAAVAAVPASGPTLPRDESMIPRGRWQTWHLVLIASILLLAFSAGGWLVDWGIRRRHGGFRV